MPLSALGAAAAAGGFGGAHSLWSYNRANYMFDVPLRQAQAFQIQNIQLARFALFREDVRDMAALTIDKVDTYMIVNTLKLGFIVSVFFNFDRTDTEMSEMNCEERSINMILTITWATSFFWLLTSIWFSMHALIVAQSLMTKMLVQVVRVPMPSAMEISDAASSASTFEHNIADAFRVPFLSNLQTFAGPQVPPATAALPPESGRKDSACSLGSCRGHGAWQHPSRDSLPQSCPSTVSTASRTEAASHAEVAVEPPQTQDAHQVNISLDELLDGVGLRDVAGAGPCSCSVEPHIKLFKLVRASWVNFDLYGKISMELGTASLLSGLAYYSIFYLRTKGSEFQVQDSAWFMFAIMSALAWWSIILDTVLPAWGHALLALAMLGGPASIFVGHVNTRWTPWAFFVAFIMQTAWILTLSWCAFAPGGKWPKTFRASLYLNVLHHEEQRPNRWKDVSLKAGEGADCAGDYADDATPPPRGRAGGASDVDEESGGAAARRGRDRSLTAGSRDEAEHRGARRAAAPVLRCLDAVLRVPNISRKAKRPIREARDELYEGCRAAGVLGSEDGSVLTVDGFWLNLGGKGGGREDHDGSLVWVSPGGAESGNPQQQGAVDINSDDLLQVVRTITRMLLIDAQLWTAEDMTKLKGYGGETLPGVRSFLAQFRPKSGSDDSLPVGLEATKIFRLGVVLVTMLWLFALVWSWSMTMRAIGPTAATAATVAGIDSPARDLAAGAAAGDRVAFHVPPWMAAGAMGCDGEAEHFALASEAGALIMQANGTGGRRGPFGACGAAGVAAADFGPDGRLWIACADGRLVAPPSAGGASAGASGGASGGPPGGPPRAAELGVDVQAWALDAAPAARGADAVEAIAVSSGRFLAMQSDREHGWRVAGALAEPPRAAATTSGGSRRAGAAGAAGAGAARWAAVALRAGRGLALDEGAGAVWEVNAASGRWRGPLRMPTRLAWTGLCILPEARGWLALGHPTDGSGGGMEMWHFAWRAPAP